MSLMGRISRPYMLLEEGLKALLCSIQLGAAGSHPWLSRAIMAVGAGQQWLVVHLVHGLQPGLPAAAAPRQDCESDHNQVRQHQGEVQAGQAVGPQPDGSAAICLGRGRCRWLQMAGRQFRVGWGSGWVCPALEGTKHWRMQATSHSQQSNQAHGSTEGRLGAVATGALEGWVPAVGQADIHGGQACRGTQLVDCRQNRPWRASARTLQNNKGVHGNHAQPYLQQHSCRAADR